MSRNFDAPKAPQGGAAVAAQRTVFKKRCTLRSCRAPFEGIAIAKFCSNKCRVKAMRLRAKGMTNEPTPQHMQEPDTFTHGRKEFKV